MVPGTEQVFNECRLLLQYKQYRFIPWLPMGMVFPSSEKAAVSAVGAWGPGSLSSYVNWGMSLHLATLSHVNIFLTCEMRGWAK